MAKPNYKFAKRQRDLEKKKKRDAKRLRKTGLPAADPQAKNESPPANDGSSGPG
jgi:hypothetical protein